MAGALAAGPVLLLIGFAKRLRLRILGWMAVVYTICTATYLWGHHPPLPSYDPSRSIRDPHAVWLYILTYFGASWTELLPHKERIIAFVSLVTYSGFVVQAMRARESVWNIEWFCLGECTLAIGVAFLTALGRVQFGPGQAFASRYQTIAMLYWAGLCTMVLLWAQRRWPRRFWMAQVMLAIVLMLSVLTWKRIWDTEVSRSENLRAACSDVMAGRASASDIRTLDIRSGLEPAVTFLRKRLAEAKSLR